MVERNAPHPTSLSGRRCTPYVVASAHAPNRASPVNVRVLIRGPRGAAHLFRVHAPCVNVRGVPAHGGLARCVPHPLGGARALVRGGSARAVADGAWPPRDLPLGVAPSTDSRATHSLHPPRHA